MELRVQGGRSPPAGDDATQTTGDAVVRSGPFLKSTLKQDPLGLPDGDAVREEEKTLV